MPKITFLFALNPLLSLAFLTFFQTGCSRDDVTSSTNQAAASQPNSALQELFACYPKAGYEVCVPSIGKGKRILVRGLQISGPSPREKEELENVLASRLGLKSKFPSLQEVASPQGEAEEALMQAESGRRLFDATAYLPVFPQTTFNTFVNYSGPNCYHTALATTGTLDGSKPRHVSRDEFELYLKTHFERVSSPQTGDLVVYNEEGSHDHVSYFWMDGLVFHKKGFKRGYGYRLTEMDLAYAAEPFEWRNPDDSTSPMTPGRKVTRGKEFYRVRGNVPKTPPTDQEQAMIVASDKFLESTMKYVRERNLADTLGTMTEFMANDLKRLFKPLEKSQSLEGQLAFARLTSLSDQIFAAIEETLYTSPFAEPNRINERFCFHDNQPTREILGAFYFYFHKRVPTSQDLDLLYKNKLSTLSKKDCRIRVDDLLGS
jgi:hypothetical protein